MTHFDKVLMQGLSKYYKKIIMIFKKKFENFFKMFQEYSKNISQKVITKAVKKWVGVVHVIPFAPYYRIAK